MLEMPDKRVIKIFDLGGNINFRKVWRHYYNDSDLVIFLIDPMQSNRSEEQLELFGMDISNNIVIHEGALLEEVKEGTKLLGIVNLKTTNVCSDQKLTDQKAAYAEILDASGHDGQISQLSWIDTESELRKLFHLISF